MNPNLYPVLSQQILKKIESNDWPGLKIDEDGMKGKGVFATQFWPHNSLLCHYGGVLTGLETVKPLYNSENPDFCKFLLEFKIDGKYFFFNHYPPAPKTFGQMMNHSSLHDNVTKKVYQTPNGSPVVLHFAKRNIWAGEELVHNYGRGYGNVELCTFHCWECIIKRGKCTTLKAFFFDVCFLLGCQFNHLDTGNKLYNN